ncbi:MAG TPA: glycosyltransferase [Rhodanobacteraceae bacterium]|nr:glycosyltransferase [Rhodanobacteraceae bacterium]
MIVKNEAHVIERCLQSLRPVIGAWAIVDTGSTDGTQALIRTLLGDLPGELIERPWVDFATNRNQALELSRKYGEYALMHDADETLEVLPQVPLPARLEGPGYYLRQKVVGSEFEYSSCKLMRHDLPWRWRGVLHEHPALDPQPALPHIGGIVVRCHCDGGRSQRPPRDKYLDDVAVLRAALATEPDNARYVFYLAQSLRDAGDLAAALEQYRRRAAMGGWAEEVWYALFQVAVLLERLKAPDGEVIDAYLRAWDARPTRAEPMCELARLLRSRGRFASAYVHACAATALPRPPDLLFVDAGVYRWRALDERAVAAYYIGRREECGRLCRQMLASPHLPPGERARVEANTRFA